MALFLAACSNGGSSSSGGDGDSDSVTTTLSQYVMPSELSAVPTANSSSSSRSSLAATLRAMASASVPSDSDYATAETRKYVEEHTLEQFDILEDVLTALNQTHYYDQIGQSPYKAMVVQAGGDGEQAQKTLEPWVVEADIIDADGNVVEPNNAQSGATYRVRVRAWIEEEGPIIKGEFIVSEPPTQNEDGAYEDYGSWTLNVSFGESTTDFFAATCEPGENGESVITLNEVFSENGPGGGGLPVEVTALMYRSPESGYGKVSFPDWEAIYGPGGDDDPTEIPLKEAAYAYNQSYLAVRAEGEDEPTFKSREDDTVEMTHRYGVYNADTGEDVLKTKSFGFPFKYTENEMTKRGYYGAWQGRHQIWAGNGDASVPENTIVTREDFGDPDADPQTYKVGPTFDGVLVERSYVTADLNDIKDIPVEIWVNQDYQLYYDDSTWYHCPQMDWSGPTPTCVATPVDFGADIGWEILTKNANDTRKQIHINGWDQSADTDKRFVYLLAGTISGNAAGFYEAEQDQQTHQLIPVEPLVPINTANVNQLWVWVGGQTYVEWSGTQWLEKEVVAFNEMYHKPTFGDTDKPYTLPEGRELYINLQGANYVVRKVNGVTTIKLELQTAANPSNVLANGAMGDVGTYIFKEPWAENNSTYTFDTDKNSDTYLMLVYASIGDNDKEPDGTASTGCTVDGVVQKDIWGIVAYDGATQVEDGNGNPLAFNWEYDSGENDWGAVTYLLNPVDDSYVLLDDPIRFESTTAVNGAGDLKTLALQYDGWMMGLPDMYEELSKNDWVMTTEVSDKIINLPTGKELTDATDNTLLYLLKPLEISQFLTLVEDTSGLDLPDISHTDALSLDSINIYSAPDMADMPSSTTILYSEGKPITN
jgi:hypothetical protein